jgi:hypothetical protein
VVRVPLVNIGEFKAYHLVPVPIPVKDKLMYIGTMKLMLCVDSNRQHYFSSEVELQKCKEPTKRKYVCKQDKQLLSSLVQEEGAVKLLKVWKNIPGSCEVNCAANPHRVDTG